MRHIRRHKKVLLIVFGLFGLIAAAALIILLYPSDRAKGEIFNGAGAFALQSVWVTQGTNHVFYYPSWSQYAVRNLCLKLKVGGNPRFKFFRTPQAGKMNLVENEDRVALWAMWTDEDGKNHFRASSAQFTDINGSVFNLELRRGVWDPPRKRGIFAFVFTNSIPLLTGGQFEVLSPGGKASFRFNSRE